MTRARNLAKLSNTDILAVDSANERLGIGTTNPTSKLHVVGDTIVTGIVTASGGFNLGISSTGTSITSGPVTTLNFVGTGNTFAVNGTTVDISISSGSGGEGTGVSSTGILTCRGFANSSLIVESIMMEDFYNEGTNYGMIGPIEVSIGATITVGLGVSYAIL